MKEKSIYCSLALKLTGMESVYFVARNFKTTDEWTELGNISAGLQEVPNGIKVSFRKSV